MSENAVRWIIIILTAILSVFTQVSKEPKEKEDTSIEVPAKVGGYYA